MNRLTLLLASLLLPLVVLHAQAPAASPDSTVKLQQSQSSDPIANLEPNDLLVKDRTLFIDSRTIFIPVDVMQKALLCRKEWPQLHIRLVNNPKVADMKLKIDRVHFTHLHTYVLSDERSSIILGAGQARALDGIIASGSLAEQVIKILLATRTPPPPSKLQQN